MPSDDLNVPSVTVGFESYNHIMKNMLLSGQLCLAAGDETAQAGVDLGISTAKLSYRQRRLRLRLVRFAMADVLLARCISTAFVVQSPVDRLRVFENACRYVNVDDNMVLQLKLVYQYLHDLDASAPFSPVFASASPEAMDVGRL